MSKALAYVLVALGLAYACLWWSYERFYGHFQVSPQDVGLSPTGSFVDLSSAAIQLGIWLVVLIALLAVVPTLAVAALMYSIDCADSDKDKGKTRRVIVFAAVGGLLFAFSFVLYERFVETWPGPVLIALGFAVVIPLALIRRSRGADPSPPDSPPDSPPESAPRRLGLARLERVSGAAWGVFLATAVIGIALIDLPTDADEAGACAATTLKAVPSLNVPIPFLHLPILNVHAQPSRLTWLVHDHQGIAPAVVYLGQANGSVLVYGSVTKLGWKGKALRTSRIPAGDVIVTMGNGLTKCPGVH